MAEKILAKEEILAKNELVEESSLDLTLRPKKLTEYVGQEKVVENLRIFIKAAKQRKEPLEHILIYGPPGLGKTTLAYIVANEIGVTINQTSGPALERAGDLASVLSNLNEGDILFIDEIHRLNRVVEEMLYPAMEDFYLDLVVGRGPSARTLKLELAKFTLVGATTRVGEISSPLRDRFGFVHRLDYYHEKDLEKIVKRSSRILDIEIDEQSAKEIAARSRGTPRIVNRLLKRVRDYAQVQNQGKIDLAITKKALLMLEIDNKGLDKVDRCLLLAIIDKFKGGPVGIETLAAATHEERKTLEEVYEPFLMQIGFLQRTPTGRKATTRAYQHLDKKEKGSLF